ncbi:Vacuolar protein sorting-associated protein 26 [Fragilaria crotonensis]|nr:Vacuolar protein sorting-associated protein 26 [Fragilaria crotonensis]
MNGELAFEASQDIKGKVVLTLPHGKKADHLGIKIQFIGRIDMGHGVHEGRPHYDFISLSRELSPPGSIFQTSTEIPFLFRNMDKEFESYVGRNVSVRYFVKLVMERKFLPPVTKERDVWVQHIQDAPEQNEPIKMEVGIEDCLHIEFEYEKRAYHLEDVIVGKIHFLLYEIMDGCPFAKDVIPVRLQLAGIPADLTPTYTAVNNRFSVRYYLNLVLVDEEDRRYFKQQEIILWRKVVG